MWGLRGAKPSLGVQEGRLSPCGRTPNCVSSQADPVHDPLHYVPPLSLPAADDRAWSTVREVITMAPGMTLVEERPGYLRAECRSRLLGFVDDLELLLEPASSVIHVRSSSRLGRRDFGVNRQRVENLRAALARRHGGQ
jgi:uncharacterized protein (DUF1499 family)